MREGVLDARLTGAQIQIGQLQFFAHFGKLRGVKFSFGFDQVARGS